MGGDARPILVVGSVALDAVHTPTESASEVLGGAASYFCLSASMFAPVRLVAVVGEDFPAAHRRLLESRPVDLTGLQVRPGKTFRWTARYSGVRLEDRETLDTQLNVFKDFHPVLPDAYRDSKVVFLANIQPAAARGAGAGARGRIHRLRHHEALAGHRPSGPGAAL